MDAESEVDLLMKKYVLLKQEIYLHSGYYKSHIKSFQLLMGGLMAFFGFVLSGKIPTPSEANWWLWWGFATFLWVVVQYLVFDLWEAQYAIMLISARIATIEEMINSRFRKRLLVWESLITPKYFSSIEPSPGITNPSFMMGLWGFIIIFSTGVFLPNLVYYALWPLLADKPYARTLIFASGFFSIGFTCLSAYVGANVMLRMRVRARVDCELFLSIPLEPEDGNKTEADTESANPAP